MASNPSLRYYNLSDAMALSKLLHKDAKALRDLAEDFFLQRKIPLAICAIESAKHHNPKLPGVDSYSAAYMVHHLAVITKSWYGILAVEDHGAGLDKIKKHYKGRLKQLEKCSSVAAESAVKLVHEAWEVLSDAKRREAYDMLMGYNHVLSSSKRTSEIKVSSKRSRNPSPASSSSSSSSSPWGYEQQASKKRKPALK